MRKTSTMFLNSRFPAFRPGLGEKHPSKLLNFLRLLNTIDTPKTNKRASPQWQRSFVHLLSQKVHQSWLNDFC